MLALKAYMGKSKRKHLVSIKLPTVRIELRTSKLCKTRRYFYVFWPWFFMDPLPTLKAIWMLNRWSLQAAGTQHFIHNEVGLCICATNANLLIENVFRIMCMCQLDKRSKKNLKGLKTAEILENIDKSNRGKKHIDDILSTLSCCVLRELFLYILWT